MIGDKNIEKELKKLKVQIGKHHQNYLIEKSKNERLESQLTEYLNQMKESKIQIKQNDVFIKEQEKEKKELKEKIAKYEIIASQLIKLADYELEE